MGSGLKFGESMITYSQETARSLQEADFSDPTLFGLRSNPVGVVAESGRAGPEHQLGAAPTLGLGGGNGNGRSNRKDVFTFWGSSAVVGL